MNTTENLFSRKSIRSYTGENISEAELQQILKAGYAAPVGMAAYDSLILTVVTNKDYLNKITAATAKLMNRPDICPLYNAPTLIIVSSKLSETSDNNMAYSNAACIVQNMALQAVELGIGTCHIWGAIRGLNSDPELVKELNLPDEFAPCCSIILGYSDEKYEVREISENRIKTEYIK